MKKILQKEESVLREKAVSVPLEDITGNKIKKILKEMSEALKNEADGVAIAAPQIGYSLRIFVVSGKIFDAKGRVATGTDIRDYPKDKPYKDMVFINPVISKLSKDKDWVPEGCLSVRPIYGKTHRSKKATVTAYNEEGVRFTRGASGLLAQIFQHETDHLDGILFIDHAKELKEEII